MESELLANHRPGGNQSGDLKGERSKSSTGSRQRSTSKKAKTEDSTLGANCKENAAEIKADAEMMALPEHICRVCHKEMHGEHSIGTMQCGVSIKHY